MRGLNLLLMLLGAFAVLTLGAAPASAMGGDSGSPCHGMAMGEAAGHGAPAPQGKGGKAIAVMNCCVSCVATPDLPSPVRTGVRLAHAPDAPRPAALPAGLTPSPEHGPPRP